jgi:hypothetical protein
MRARARIGAGVEEDAHGPGALPASLCAPATCIREKIVAAFESFAAGRSLAFRSPVKRRGCRYSAANPRGPTTPLVGIRVKLPTLDSATA